MDNLKNSIIDISTNYYKYLMNLENVTGIGLGFKEINGTKILEPCIHVLVEKKVNIKYLSKNNIVPNKYMGITTDVIEVRKTILKHNKKIPFKLRPLECGGSISTEDEASGTICCIVTNMKKHKRRYYILSNNHILADGNYSDIGIPIIQPGDIVGGSFKTDKIAHLTTFVPINYVEDDSKKVNFMDAAIGEVINSQNISNKVYGIGAITGVSKAILGETVKKVGSTTGFSSGIVETTNVTMTVPFSNYESAVFVKQIRANFFNDGGDSGSPVLNDKNEIVGLFYSGSDDNKSAYFNDIGLVLEKLNVGLFME